MLRFALETKFQVKNQLPLEEAALKFDLIIYEDFGLLNSRYTDCGNNIFLGLMRIACILYMDL